MAGYPSNLAKKFYPTEQFPQHILPLLMLYNAQWWGYESLTAIVLVYFGLIFNIIVKLTSKIYEMLSLFVLGSVIAFTVCQLV